MIAVAEIRSLALFRSGLLLGLSLFSTVPLIAKEAPAALPPKEAAEAFLAATVEEQKIPGLSAIVVLDRKLWWKKGFGMADLEAREPATPGTIYRLASVSKPIAATAAVKLAEEGVLDLEKSVHDYLPDYPATGRPLTTKHLLGHLGGIRHYRGMEISRIGRHENLESALAIFSGDPLVSEPGGKYHYSTYGYTLAGRVMEVASGEEITECIQRLVGRPAGMTTLQADGFPRKQAHLARGYRLAVAGLHLPAEPGETGYKIPGGGLRGSVEDLANFAIALMDGKLVSEKSLEVMWTPQRTSDGKATGYGIGWQIARHGSKRTILHGGAQQGVSTCLYLRPDEGMAVAVLCNLEKADATGIARRLADIVSLPDETGE